MRDNQYTIVDYKDGQIDVDTFEDFSRQIEDLLMEGEGIVILCATFKQHGYHPPNLPEDDPRENR
jgi:Fe-S cluster assembly ATPase SufC